MILRELHSPFIEGGLQSLKKHRLLVTWGFYHQVFRCWADDSLTEKREGGYLISEAPDEEVLAVYSLFGFFLCSFPSS